MNKVALVTGSSGFIGFHLSMLLLSNNWKVVGIDSMSNYYDINLKKNRLKKLLQNSRFHNYEGLIQNDEILEDIFTNHKPDIIIHLAAQAGVRYSIDFPSTYVDSNLIGTFKILELSRKYKPKHLLIASTSSVYSGNIEMPLDENKKTSTPVSFYAATKKSNEVMAHSYSHLFKIPTTIFRFFTVYGPWGRPDMALFKFTKNILLDRPIDVYNNGNMKRDFTYVKDLVEAIKLLITAIPLEHHKRNHVFKNDSISTLAPYRIVNIGNSKPVNLLDYIEELEKVLGKKSKKNFLGMQDGDVKETHSNASLLRELIGFSPQTTIKEGIVEFVKWYKSYYK